MLLRPSYLSVRSASLAHILILFFPFRSVDSAIYTFLMGKFSSTQSVSHLLSKITSIIISPFTFLYITPTHPNQQRLTAPPPSSALPPPQPAPPTPPPS